MITYFISKDELSTKINYSVINKDLVEIFSDLQSIYNINFTIRLSTPIITSISSNNRSLESILQELENIWHLHYVIKEDNIFISECEEVWKNYKLNFFFEESLPTNMNTIDNAITSERNAPVYRIWEEIAMNLSKFTNDNYVIDKYNGLVNVYGDCKVHALVNNYLNDIIQNYLTQIHIECKIIEISCETKYNTLINNIINNIPKSIAIADIITSLQALCVGIVEHYHTNVGIKSTKNIKMLLLSQQSGYITLNKQEFIGRDEYIYDKSVKHNTKTTKYDDCISGFSLMVVPIIVEQNNEKRILLKVRPSIRNTTNNYQHNNKSDLIVNKQELISTINITSNTPVIVGAFDLAYDTISENTVTNIPILSYFLNNWKHVNMTSHFIIFITASIQ